MVELYMPTSTGEWLAWSSAIITLFFGFLLLLAPRLSFRIMRLQTVSAHPEAISEGRATMAGFYLGTGFCVVLLAQPLLYIALGAGWGFTAFGRFVSMFVDRGMTLFNLISILIEGSLAAAPLLYAFGVI